MSLFLQIIAVVLLLHFHLVHSDRVSSEKTEGGCQSSSLKLKCQTSSENVIWFKNGNELDVSGDRMTVNYTTVGSTIVEASLTIKDITIDDEGNYSCINTTDPSPITGKS